MNTTTKLILVTLSLLVISTASIARDSHRNSALGYSGGHHSQKSSVYLGYSKNRNHHYKKHYSYNRHSTRSYDDNYNRNYKQHSYNTNYRRPCHPTSKTIIDHYGNYKNIGGTMCYDSNGYGYIVGGSRYLRH